MSAYNPPWIYRNANTNTILAASALRKSYALNVSKAFRQQSKSVLLTLEQNVRLQGLFNNSKSTLNQPLVIMLHGWLGCAESLYQLPLASKLHALGFNVFRLNFRDHGNTQHLNNGLFHSCRLDEVTQAITAIQHQIIHTDLYVIGYSLGGNFALRIGAEAKENNLYIKKIFAISPVMDPDNALNETETMLKIYTGYYLKRWKVMLRKKHEFFPNDYDLRLIAKQKSLTNMTEHLLLKYTEFDSLQDYLKGYSITDERLKTLSVPSEVFIAEDDPVIPANDKDKLYASKFLNIQVSKFGGHCAYLNGLFKPSWTDERIYQEISS